MRLPSLPLVLAASAAFALAGCAASPASPSAPDSPPVSALPLGCADLLTLEQVQQAIVEPISVEIDETTPPSPIDAVGFAQVGGLHCTWRGEHTDEEAWSTGVELRILPHAALAYETWAAEAGGGGNPIADYGDDSRVTCSPGDVVCGGAMLVDHYWVDFYYGDRGGELSGNELSATVSSLIEPVVAAIRGAGPARDGWGAPPSTLDAELYCDGYERIARSLDVPLRYVDVDPEDRSTDLYPERVGAYRAGVEGCNWAATGHDDVQGQAGWLEVLPWGDWVFPGYAEHPPTFPATAATTKAEVGGHDAYVGCSPRFGCRALVALDGGLLEYSASVTELDEFVPMLERLLVDPYA